MSICELNADLVRKKKGLFLFFNVNLLILAHFFYARFTLFLEVKNQRSACILKVVNFDPKLWYLNDSASLISV